MGIAVRPMSFVEPAIVGKDVPPCFKEEAQLFRAGERTKTAA